MGDITPYARLAGVYDELVVDPCYSDWADFLDALWADDPAGRLVGPRRVLRHRPADRRAGRARLRPRRRRRLAGDARAGAHAARARRPAARGDASRPARRGDVRRGGVHLRRPQLPHARRPAAAAWPRSPRTCAPAAGWSSTSTPTSPCRSSSSTPSSRASRTATASSSPTTSTPSPARASPTWTSPPRSRRSPSRSGTASTCTATSRSGRRCADAGFTDVTVVDEYTLVPAIGVDDAGHLDRPPDRTRAGAAS